MLKSIHFSFHWKSKINLEEYVIHTDVMLLNVQNMDKDYLEIIIDIIWNYYYNNH